MSVSKLEDRFTLVATDVDSALNAFAEDVAVGLTACPKRLSSCYFYDREGGRLFEEICKLPEYYLTRAEREILEARAGEIASGFSDEITLVELGSGSAVKTRLLIEAFLERQGRLRFVPVDISQSTLEESSIELLGTYPELEVLGIAAEYHDGLARLKEEIEGPRLILWLGSNVGNFDRPDAVRFLARVGETMAGGDRFLVGTDLRKDRAVLEAAYDDTQGVTARFNQNLLARINRELGGQFDLARFQHRAVYKEAEGRVEIHQVSTCAQTVAIEDLDMEVVFAQGEAIHTENSYKYSIAEIDALAKGAGLEVERRWFDSERRFGLNMLKRNHGNTGGHRSADRWYLNVQPRFYQ